MSDKALLWFDDDRTLAEKVRGAAERYWQKHKVAPNVCFVHLSALDSETRIDGWLCVAPLTTVLRHCFWVGVEEESNVRPKSSAWVVVRGDQE